MNTSNQFIWTDFYQEFAQRLVAYKDNRSLLVEKVKKFMNFQVYQCQHWKKIIIW